MMSRSIAPLSLALVLGSGCVAGQAGAEDNGASAAITNNVPGSVRVNGSTYSVETDYLPRVVQCEDPGGSEEALRAQAIAARTFLTFKTAGQSAPSIGDGQQDQVFTCASNHNGSYVPAAVMQAVQSTAGQIVMHNGSVIAGFFVAGASRDDSCNATTDATNTERFVTINEGKSGDAVEPSALGSSSNPANRGALGQNLTNCLATSQGLAASQLLAYFYGADITVQGNVGPTSITSAPTGSTGSAPSKGSTGSSGSTGSTGPTDSTGAGAGVCFSFTTQTSLPLAACVQSSVDQMWYQCESDGSFVSGVDADDGTGPVGNCNGVYALN